MSGQQIGASAKKMAYLIDTSIIVYSLKNDRNVNARFKETENIPKSISVITYGELVYGAKKSQQVERSLAMSYRIAELFPIIDINRSIIDIFGEIKSGLARKGNIIDDMDVLIAATALSHNLILVTNNVGHFGGVEGLKIENWKE